MNRIMVVGLVLLLGVVSAPGQEGVTFKPNIPAPGQLVKITIEEKSTLTKAFTVKGVSQKADEAKTKSFIYVDETLENTDMGKRATKLKRTYEKAVVSANGSTQTLPAEGKTVLIEKSGGKYAYTIDGKPATGEVAALLEAEFNKTDNLDGPELFFPKTPVKAGDSWKVDKAPLLKLLSASGIMLDEDKAVATGTLTKAFKKGQSQYGNVSFTFETPITGLGPKAPIKLDDGKMSMKVEGEGCLDGASPDGKTVMRVQFSVKGSGTGFDIDIKNETTETRTVELVKK